MKITYVMKNGTIRDSMEGYVVPYNKDTEMYYRIWAEILGLKLKPLEKEVNK